MYTKEIKLKDNQIPATIDVETGEVNPIYNRPNNIPEGKSRHNYKEEFAKVYTTVDSFLLKMLTPHEYRVVAIMRNRTQMNTNSLEPLSDDSSIKEISEILDINRNKVTKIINKLRDLGVFATFEVTNRYRQRIKSWILNPYISFKGKVISDEIINLFDDTIIASIAKK